MTRGDEIDDAVRIQRYDSSWPARFEAEEVLLHQAIGQWVTGGIHHVGSTAVPGLAAKPVIDILVGVEDLPSSRGCGVRLLKLDYQYAPYRADQMHWFCKPGPSRRTHHLHLVPTDSHRYRGELAFRDALRARPDLAAGYARLKRALARDFEHHRDGYTEAKAAFIEKALVEIRTAT
jgi:GrpB-like predicted nucleotidyltransferase (UPF0157 family)